MARVGFDIDNVLFDFSGAFHRYAEVRLRRTLPVGKTWKFFEAWGIDQDEFDGLHVDFADDDEYAFGALIGGLVTVQSIKDLRDAGHQVILVTARHTADHTQSATIERQTREWLDDEGVPYDELYFSTAKTEIELDYFLDDRPENFEAFHNETEVESFLYSQPWNDDVCAFGHRVFSVKEYVANVLEMEAPGPWVELGFTSGGFLQATPVKAEDVVTYQNPVPDPGSSWTSEAGEVRITNEVTGGQKGSKLARFDLIPAEALKQVAEHYGRGAKKYADNNWRKGYNWSLSLAALERHLNAFKSGEDFDEETTSNHMAAVVFHALALLTFYDEHPELDDRWSTIKELEALDCE